MPTPRVISAATQNLREQRKADNLHKNKQAFLEFLHRIAPSGSIQISTTELSALARQSEITGIAASIKQLEQEGRIKVYRTDRRNHQIGAAHHTYLIVPQPAEQP